MKSQREREMTPEEKSARGLPLSATDIAYLLTLPGSWLSQLYTQCLAEAAISRKAFCRYVAAVMEEKQLAEVNEQAAKREAEARANDPRYYQPQQSKSDAQEALLLSMPVLSEILDPKIVPFSALSPLTVLNVQLTALLNLSQEEMDDQQLAVHHSNITTNFNNQIAAKLGTTMQLQLIDGQSITLNVPQYSSKPAASAARYALAFNATQLRDFAEFNTNATTGYVASLTKFREILEENRDKLMSLSIDIDNRNFSPAELIDIDVAVQWCKENNKDLFKHLLENNLRLLGLFDTPVLTARVSQPPAIFGETIKTGPGFERKKAIEVVQNEKQNRPFSGIV